MKLIIFLSLCLAAAFAVEDHEVFTQELIDYVNSQAGITWKAGVNDHFKGWTKEQYVKVLGSHRIQNPKMRLPTKKIVKAKDIPTTFDSRTQWPKCPTVSEIRDQCACGSCWAFGAVEAISDRICIASDAKYTPRISAEDMNSCCTSCGDGCNGGYPEAAWQYWVNTGLVTGGNYTDPTGCFPYSLKPCDHHTTGKYQPCGDSQNTPKCTDKCQSGYSKTWDNDLWYGKTAYHVEQDIEKIQTEIMTNGPVETDFTVYADFESYKSGVYKHTTGSALGGHAVKILGWGTEDGTDYWLIANSWNTDWGLDGYFKIVRGVNECGIEADIQAGLPKLPQ